MKILIIYFNNDFKIRKTIDEHLYSFRRYAQGVEFHYFNALFGIPRYLTRVPYDGVILHYTFFGNKHNRYYYDWYFRAIRGLGLINAPKVAMPQDENAHTDYIRKILKEYSVETIYTCAYEKEYNVFYPPDLTGVRHVFTDYTGYIDENTLADIEALPRKEGRPIDIGYRARQLPYWLGKHSQKKYEIGERVKEYCRKNTDLTINISSNAEDTLYGDQWLHFLLNCRVVLGCEGGASLLDADDSVRKRVEAYTTEHTEATFEETEAACFPGRDNSIRYFALSPRHFECCMTRTCQVLLEGEYAGIFKPGVHYIELKEDYSNLEEVIEKVGDVKYCRQIADNAYRDIVASGKYTYRVFVNEVMGHIRGLAGQPGSGKVMFALVGFILWKRDIIDPLLKIIFRVWHAVTFGKPKRWYLRMIAKLVHKNPQILD
jgi:hypothetical protein